MARTAVVLGPVSFREFEVPEHLHKASGYIYATHRLGSGGEVIDGVGPEEGYIGFSGVFTGSDARDRCVLLDSLRASGLVMPLIWPGNYCTVVIKKLSLDFHQPAWIPYRILCSVIWSLDSLTLSLESPPAQVMAEDSAAVSEMLSGTGIDWDGTARGRSQHARSLGLGYRRCQGQIGRRPGGDRAVLFVSRSETEC
jgi:hypothetical protein